VKLLLDQNLSQRLCTLLSAEFPETAHVRHFNLQEALDATIWKFAADHSYTIVSKDQDFHQRSFLYGHPPKVVWLRLGNCSTARIAEAPLTRAEDLRRFDADPLASFLVLS
jgi:predicted nuclease of predicted toxin-antitoxin system